MLNTVLLNLEMMSFMCRMSQQKKKLKNNNNKTVAMRNAREPTKCARKHNLTNEWKYEGKKMPVARDENVVIAEEEKENMQRFFCSWFLFLLLV